MQTISSEIKTISLNNLQWDYNLKWDQKTISNETKKTISNEINKKNRQPPKQLQHKFLFYNLSVEITHFPYESNNLNFYENKFCQILALTTTKQWLRSYQNQSIVR